MAISKAELEKRKARGAKASKKLPPKAKKAPPKPKEPKVDPLESLRTGIMASVKEVVADALSNAKPPPGQRLAGYDMDIGRKDHKIKDVGVVPLLKTVKVVCRYEDDV